MVWRRPGDKPLSEPMVISLLTHTFVTRPQWVKANSTFYSTQQSYQKNNSQIRIKKWFIRWYNFSWQNHVIHIADSISENLTHLIQAINVETLECNCLQHCDNSGYFIAPYLIVWVVRWTFYVWRDTKGFPLNPARVVDSTSVCHLTRQLTMASGNTGQ